jgi:hypothetical protein
VLSHVIECEFDLYQLRSESHSRCPRTIHRGGLSQLFPCSSDTLAGDGWYIARLQDGHWKRLAGDVFTARFARSVKAGRHGSAICRIDQHGKFPTRTAQVSGVRDHRGSYALRPNSRRADAVESCRRSVYSLQLKRHLPFKPCLT